jgi:hypothetical protein
MNKQRLKWTFGFVAVALGVTGSAVADDAKTSRYPYDPACAWGRIANGKGMLVRCLEEKEALALVQGGSAKPASPPEAEPKKPEPSGPLNVEVGPITADEGKLGIGQLHVPKDRYRQCVDEHGGLEGDDGEVHVRFLVRGDRSRAEGVSVSKRRNMSREAAKCVADVVDRRRVGTPDKPMVGATLVIKFSR